MGLSQFDHYQHSDAGDDKARQQDGEQDAHFAPALVALQAREQQLSQIRGHNEFDGRLAVHELIAGKGSRSWK
jgi:hypothetical protein